MDLDIKLPLEDISVNEGSSIVACTVPGVIAGALKLEGGAYAYKSICVFVTPMNNKAGDIKVMATIIHDLLPSKAMRRHHRHFAELLGDRILTEVIYVYSQGNSAIPSGISLDEIAKLLHMVKPDND